MSDGTVDGDTGMWSPPSHAQHASKVLFPRFVYGARNSHHVNGSSAICVQVRPLQVPVGSNVVHPTSSTHALGNADGRNVGTDDGDSEG